MCMPELQQAIQKMQMANAGLVTGDAGQINQDQASPLDIFAAEASQAPAGAAPDQNFQFRVAPSQGDIRGAMSAGAQGPLTNETRQPGPISPPTPVVMRTRTPASSGAGAVTGAGSAERQHSVPGSEAPAAKSTTPAIPEGHPGNPWFAPGYPKGLRENAIRSGNLLADPAYTRWEPWMGDGSAFGGHIPDQWKDARYYAWRGNRGGGGGDGVGGGGGGGESGGGPSGGGEA